MKTEIELKLTLPKAQPPALRRHPLVASAPRAAPTATLLNTYFDTPTLLLSKHRIALRTRKQGRRWLQTVKADASSSGGLSARPEWEGPYSEAFDFSSIDAAETRKLLEGAAAELIPLFTTDFRRETRRLTPSPGISMLMMIDQGKIAAGDRETRCARSNSNSRAAGPRISTGWRSRSPTSLPLLPNDSSKAQRGLELFHNRPALPMRAQPLRFATPTLRSRRFARWRWTACGSGRRMPSALSRAMIRNGFTRCGSRCAAPARRSSCSPMPCRRSSSRTGVANCATPRACSARHATSTCSMPN